MNEQQLINQWLRAQKEPFIECQDKKGNIYYLNIEKHKIHTLEEVREWAKQIQSTLVK